jgi:hypothetical protein
VPHAGLGLDITEASCLRLTNSVHLQLAFLKNLSSNPSNIVIGIVRNVAEAEAKVSAWDRSNIHIIHGDMNDYDSLRVFFFFEKSLMVANK